MYLSLLPSSRVAIVVAGFFLVNALPSAANDESDFNTARQRAKALEEVSDYRRAITEYQRAVVLATRIYGDDSVEAAKLDGRLGHAYRMAERFGDAKLHLERSLKALEANLGNDHADLAQVLHDLAVVEKRDGQSAEAERLLKRCIAIREANVPDHPDLAKSLNNLAAIYYAQREFDKASTLYERSIRIREAFYGKNHLEVVPTLQNLALVYADTHQYELAESLLLRGLRVRETALGRDDPKVAESLNQLADLYLRMGEYARCVPLLQRSLMINETHWGLDHLEVAKVLHGLASTYKKTGEYDQAASLLERSLSIREAKLGPEEVVVGDTLVTLANLYSETGHYARAEPLYERAIEIYESKLVGDHPALALALNNHGNLFHLWGKYERAEPLLRRSIEIYERKLGIDHPQLARPLNNLGSLYGDMAQYDEAESLLLRCLQIREAKLGHEHPDVASTLNSLAIVYRAMGDYARAEPLYRRCLAIDEARLGPDHAEVATDLNNLALVLDDMRRSHEAESMYERSLKIREAALGPTHPVLATTLNNLGRFYAGNGDYARAEPLYQRSLTIQEASLSADHPKVILTLNNLAVLHAKLGQDDLAADEFDRERRSVRRHVARVLPVLGAREQLAFINGADEKHFHLALSFGRQHADEPASAERSAAWLLNGKSVVVGSLAERALLARDANDPQLRHQIDQLAQIRTQLAGMCRAAPKSGEEAAFRQRLTRLARDEQEMARRVNLAAGLGVQDDPWVEISAVRKTLRTDSVLIEIARFRPHELRVKADENAWLPPRYVAWLIPEASSNVRVIDLGEADAIDFAVMLARRAIEDSAPTPDGTQTEVAAEKLALGPLRELAKLVLDPFLPALDNVNEIILSPDSQLWLAPWSALPMPDGRYAIERWTLRYVTSGRELVRSRARADFAKQYPPTRPAIFADPDYDLSAERRRTALAELLPGRIVSVPQADEPLPLTSGVSGAQRLPGTAEEARLVAPSLEQLANAPAAVYTADRALEDVLKNTRSPRVLVLSTHGFYLPAPLVDDNQPIGNPLLRCGLLLAGCNTPAGKTPVDDGVVTGMEVVSCDLRGCAMVVLSACETGIGQVRNGEGVAGLRQAFQLAGAWAVVSTLWRIPDKETAALMSGFFKELAKGSGKSEALRAAQIDRIKARRAATGAAHPMFWAAFTVTGS